MRLIFSEIKKPCTDIACMVCIHCVFVVPIIRIILGFQMPKIYIEKVGFANFIIAAGLSIKVIGKFLWAD